MSDLRGSLPLDQTDPSGSAIYQQQPNILRVRPPSAIGGMDPNAQVPAVTQATQPAIDAATQAVTQKGQEIGQRAQDWAGEATDYARAAMGDPQAQERARSDVQAGLTGAEQTRRAMLADPTAAVAPGILAGETAIGAPLSGLSRAKAMEAGAYPHNAPVDRDTIFQQTGWYRAPDMNWKFVIPDRDANLRHGNLISGTIQSGPKAGQQVVAPKPGLRLEDVLFHPTLFRSYPYLRNVKLDLLPQDKWGTSAGGYERSTGTIYLAPLAESELLPTLLHETQHVIQNAEGFARGGSPREFLRPDWGSDFATVQAQMNAIRQTIQSIGVDPAEVAAVHGITGAPVTAITPQMQKNASKVPPFVIQKMKDATNKWNQLAQERRAAIQTYLNLGGEVESRVVERMLHNRNWDQPPWQAGEMLLQGGGAQPIPYTPESQQDIRFRPQTVPQP